MPSAGSVGGIRHCGGAGAMGAPLLYGIAQRSAGTIIG
jgi:hypothetical protein